MLRRTGRRGNDDTRALGSGDPNWSVNTREKNGDKTLFVLISLKQNLFFHGFAGGRRRHPLVLGLLALGYYSFGSTNTVAGSSDEVKLGTFARKQHGGREHTTPRLWGSWCASLQTEWASIIVPGHMHFFCMRMSRLSQAILDIQMHRPSKNNRGQCESHPTIRTGVFCGLVPNSRRSGDPRERSFSLRCLVLAATGVNFLQTMQGQAHRRSSSPSLPLPPRPPCGCGPVRWMPFPHHREGAQPTATTTEGRTLLSLLPPLSSPSTGRTISPSLLPREPWGL